jgi:uridine phosphorylase
MFNSFAFWDKDAKVIKIYVLKKIAPTELILNPNGSIYHLQLLPKQLAENVIIVGDPGRVNTVSALFDKVVCRVQNREFLTHTGLFNGKPVSVISTGIGTDNIDIVMNELDALVNIDLKKRTVKAKKISLNIVRVGTSGALQKDISVGSFIVSEYGLGLDGLLNYYDRIKVDEKNISDSFKKHMAWSRKLPSPYTVKGSHKLIEMIGSGMIKGITATAPGFYAPQGRSLRLSSSIKNLEKKLSSFKYRQLRILNFEMETSAFYGLSKLLGHHACTVCVVVANRITKEFSGNYHPSMQTLIKTVLRRLTSQC